jgi:hypothetical protein
MKTDFQKLWQTARAFKMEAARARLRARSRVHHHRSMLGPAVEVDRVRSSARFQELLTPEELAQRLKVPTSWVYEKRRPRCKNPLPAVPLGKMVRFDWDAIVAWLEKQVAEDAAGINRRRSIKPVRRIRRERATA